MKYLIPVLFFSFLVIFESSGQNNASISGKVIAQETDKSLEYVTIMLHKQEDSTLVTGAYSDETGRFLISDMAPGNYFLQFSFLGYTTIDIPVLIGEKNQIYDIGKVQLSVEGQQLEQVIVQEQRATVSGELDSKTFSVKDNIAQSGGSILDAMKALPGINVDQEGKVLLRGSDKVIVLIDGKRSSLTGFGNQKGLDNIPAANIERIEIINNPSSKYEASGMGGIINIIYKKGGDKGWNGDIGITLGLAELTIKKENLPTELGAYHVNPKIIPSLNLNYRGPSLNFFLQSEVIYQKKLPNNEFTTREYSNGDNIISQVPENRTQTHYILRSGVDWKINKKNTLSFSTIIDYESHIDTAQIPYINLASDIRSRFWHWKEDEVTGYLNFRLLHEYHFEGAGHKLQTSLQYTRGWEDEQYFLNDSSIYRQSTDRTHLIATEHTTTFNVDYVKPLFSGRLELGSLVQWRTIPVTYEIGQGDQSIIYPGLGEWSDWGETLYSGYLNYIYERPKFDIEAGIRLEQTDVFYDVDPSNIYYEENDAYNYFRVYPNVRLTLKLNEVNNLSVFFNNRVDRPGEPNLRVFPKYDDPELLKVGNPYVRPQFTQTYELAYKRLWNTGSVFLAAYYRDIDNPFIRVYSIDASNNQYQIINKIYQNVGSGSNLGIEILLSENFSNYWKTTASFNWYKNEIDAFSGILLFPFERAFTIKNTSDLTWDFKWNNQINLGSGSQLQFTGIYLAPKNTPQGRQLSRASFDLGFKQNIFENKAELIFSVTDLFNTFNLREEIIEEDFTALYENYYETQVFRTGFKYKF